MIQNLLYLILLILGFVFGIILSKLCKDEIKKWKGRLFFMSGASLLLIVVVSFTGFAYKFPVMIGLFFIIITCLTVIWKGYS